MRAILLLLILAVVGLIVLIATGLLDINQTKPAEVPQVSVTENGVVAKGGQAPAFDVETGTVSVGSEPANLTVAVPTVQVNRADGNQAQPATTNRAQ
jgi:hypothetical protein